MSIYKRLFISILPLLALILFSCEKKTDDFSVKGKLSNISDTCFYVAFEKNNKPAIDTIKVNKNGEFSFTGHVDTLTVMSMYFNNNEKYSYILVDKGWNVEMKGDVLYSDLIEVKGGDVNDDLTSFKLNNKDLLSARTRILDSEENESREDSIIESESRSHHLGEFKNINFELSNVAAEYIKANPDKIASVILIDIFFKNELSIDRLDESLNLLTGKAETFPLTYRLREYSQKIKLSKVGAYAPNFTLKDTKDKDIRLTEYRGKYVLLSFVSTTCKACDMERPGAIKIYNQLKKEKANIEFITVVINTEIEPIPKAATDSVKWTILPDNGSWSAKTFDQYNIHEVPYNILISPQGTILDRDITFLALPERIKELTAK
jgi:peroxiredoxin